MAKSRVVDRDLGYSRIRRLLGGLARKEPTVFVGIRAGAGTTDDGTPLALVAAVNEFGSTDGHVPERSFLRSTMDENAVKYAAEVSGAVGKQLDGKQSLRVGLGKVGARVAGDVKRKITAIKDPPNAPSTIEKKGSSNPLIDTGRLRQSIDFEVKGL